MAKPITWYQQGFNDAMAGLNCDPPMHPGHGSYVNYCAGYHDGERQVERDANRTEQED